MDILKPDKSSSGQGWRSSVIMTEITTLLHTGSSGESSKKRIFYSQTDLKGCIFETPHDESKCALSIKESNSNAINGWKFSHLLAVIAKGTSPPYGQSDRKISFFGRLP